MLRVLILASALGVALVPAGAIRAADAIQGSAGAIHATRISPAPLVARPWSEEDPQPLLVFVSFSMPAAELRELAAQSARAGASLILRGVVEGSFPATQARLAVFRDIEGASFQIDPTLFRRFRVETVPAFVLPLAPLVACAAASCPAPDAAVVRGSASVDGALAQIERRAGSASARRRAGILRVRLKEASR